MPSAHHPIYDISPLTVPVAICSISNDSHGPQHSLWGVPALQHGLVIGDHCSVYTSMHGMRHASRGTCRYEPAAGSLDGLESGASAAW